MNGRALRWSMPLWVLFVVLTAGCGQGGSPPDVSADEQAARADASASPLFAMPNGAFSVASLPPGFKLRGEPETGPGPLPGTSSNVMFFVNETAGQQLVVSVHSGTPAAELTSANRYEHPEPSSRKVQGRDTYTASFELTKQRGVVWVVDDETTAYVIGENVSDEELFAVAEEVRVSADKLEVAP